MLEEKKAKMGQQLREKGEKKAWNRRRQEELKISIKSKQYSNWDVKKQRKDEEDIICGGCGESFEDCWVQCGHTHTHTQCQ